MIKFNHAYMAHILSKKVNKRKFQFQGLGKRTHISGGRMSHSESMVEFKIAILVLILVTGVAAISEGAPRLSKVKPAASNESETTRMPPADGGNIKMMLNAIALSRESPGINSSLLLTPLAQIDRIEVIRGPGSSIYGDFAMAGVVNIISKGCQGCFLSEVGLYSPISDELIGIARFSVSDRLYRNLNRDVHKTLFIHSRFGTLLLVMVWGVVMFLIRKINSSRRQAEIANQSKSAFLANMSHELRTPLNAIIGFSELMGYATYISEKHRENLAIIHRSGAYLLELINDVLELSKIEAARDTQTETAFDLCEALDKVTEMIRLRAEKKNAVNTAENGRQALAFFKQWEPCLIWMDMRMPVMDGYEATKMIRRAAAKMLAPSPVILALTASAFNEDRDAVLAAGCDDFVRRPFGEAEIFYKIQEHLGVNYIYACEENPAAEKTVTGALSIDVLRTAITRLPNSVVQEFRTAIELSDVDRMARAIAEIGAAHATLANGLKELVDTFQYDRILSFLDEADKDSVGYPGATR
jgi:CheY-like chemotaxis protein